MYLFFDTETTGLPKNYKAPISDLDNWPRMVQIAWMLYDDSGQLISQNDYIIRPEGYVIPAEVSKIHGITHERALREGIELNVVLLEFSELISKTKNIVAHNIGFDEKILLAEFLRKDITHQFNQKKQICTMAVGTNICKIPGKFGFKWPKLSELHVALFNRDFEEAHNAAQDIKATANCFWEMKRRQMI